MSALNKSDKYYELYRRYKSLVDRADNDTVDVIYYIDKKHRCKARLDTLTGNLILGTNEIHWSKGVAI